PINGITLSDWVQSLRTVIGKSLLRVGIQKPHWQEGFFDHVLRSHECYSQKWGDGRMNPVRGHLSKTPEECPTRAKLSGLPLTSSVAASLCRDADRVR